RSRTRALTANGPSHTQLLGGRGTARRPVELLLGVLVVVVVDRVADASVLVDGRGLRSMAGRLRVPASEPLELDGGPVKPRPFTRRPRAGASDSLSRSTMITRVPPVYQP